MKLSWAIKQRKYVERIAKEEGLEMDDKAIEALIYVGDGDMRKLTNVLQSAAMFSKKITESEVYNVASRARPTEIISMLKYSVEGNFEKAREELDTPNLITQAHWSWFSKSRIPSSRSLKCLPPEFPKCLLALGY